MNFYPFQCKQHLRWKRQFYYQHSQRGNSLDWVYIDTDHTYKTTKEELEAAAKAVKPEGYYGSAVFYGELGKKLT